MPENGSKVSAFLMFFFFVVGDFLGPAAMTAALADRWQHCVTCGEYSLYLGNQLGGRLMMVREIRHRVVMFWRGGNVYDMGM